MLAEFDVEHGPRTFNHLKEFVTFAHQLLASRSPVATPMIVPVHLETKDMVERLFVHHRSF
jgi:hypothetical protein